MKINGKKKKKEKDFISWGGVGTMQKSSEKHKRTRNIEETIYQFNVKRLSVSKTYIFFSSPQLPTLKNYTRENEDIESSWRSSDL